MKEAARRYRSGSGKKQNKRRKPNPASFMLVYIALSFLAVVILIVLSFTVFFKVADIKVIGKTRYSEAEIVKASKLTTGNNLFMTNVNEAKKIIKQKLPYIDEVKISKNLPSEIRINVKEAVPIGQLEKGKDYIVLDANNKVLEVLHDKPMKGCPVIRGILLNEDKPGSVAVFKDDSQKNNLKIMLDGLKKSEITKISVISFIEPLNLCATYHNKIVIEFGSVADLNLKLQYAKAIIEHPKSAGRTGRLNVSIVSGSKVSNYFETVELTPAQTADVF
ncbi:MAG: hypothetical protein BGN88_05155 [Clostridiales bacterium 43-6]|nr:MAG: hypothetical protein BGN88_05155 [Clostridiales bacterium 43-6]